MRDDWRLLPVHRGRQESVQLEFQSRNIGEKQIAMPRRAWFVRLYYCSETRPGKYGENESFSIYSDKSEEAQLVLFHEWHITTNIGFRLTKRVIFPGVFAPFFEDWDKRKVDATMMSLDAISSTVSSSLLWRVVVDIQGANRSISACHWLHKVMGAITNVALERNTLLTVELVHPNTDGGGK